MRRCASETSAQFQYLCVDDSGKVPFVVELLNLIKTAEFKGIHGICLEMLYDLIRADCVDEDVISGVIDFGLNHVSNPMDSGFPCLAIHFMLEAGVV